jgi:hypothetical protein
MTVTLDLTPEELSLLRDTLESALSDLRVEITSTERLAMRRALREREAAIRKALEGIAEAGEGAART